MWQLVGMSWDIAYAALHWALAAGVPESVLTSRVWGDGWQVAANCDAPTFEWLPGAKMCLDLGEVAR